MSQKLIVSSFTRTGTLHGGLRIEGGTGAGRKECPANNGPLEWKVPKMSSCLVLY
jgi:hypothetical protein